MICNLYHIVYMIYLISLTGWIWPDISASKWLYVAVGFNLMVVSFGGKNKKER